MEGCKERTKTILQKKLLDLDSAGSHQKIADKAYYDCTRKIKTHLIGVIFQILLSGSRKRVHFLTSSKSLQRQQNIVV